MKVNDVYNLTVSIVNKANDLKNKYTDEIKANVSYAAIFCQSTDEYNKYIELLKEDNNEIIQDTYSGPVFNIKGLNTNAGTLKLLKVRRYDENHPDMGDADFKVSNYDNFKTRYINNPNFKLIEGDGFEMLELMDKDSNVRAYFPNIPLDVELGIE